MYQANNPVFSIPCGIAVSLLMSMAVNVSAEGYGIFEARGLAMGGTAVAIGSTDNALFYNPALLSFHDGDEDKTADGSVYFPIVSAQVADSIQDILDIEDDDLDSQLTTSVDAFNANPNQDTAQSVANSSRDLLGAIETLDDEDVFGDGFVGMSLTEPGDREGAGFYWGARVLGGGKATITDSDQALLVDYVEGLEFVASGGSRGVAHPELFNGGVLIAPVDSLTSFARVKGAGIVEFGVSLSKEYALWGLPVAFGITPKLMKIRTYEAVQAIRDGDVESSHSEQDFNSGNVDIGFAVEFADHYRMGVAVKDVITKDFATDLGNTVTIKAKPRLGLGYVTEQFQLGLDVDLATVAAIGEEASIQEASLGGEWRVLPNLFVRGGYRHDLKGERDDIVSLGIGAQYGRFLFDVAYAQGRTSRGLSLQVGFRR